MECDSHCFVGARDLAPFCDTPTQVAECPRTIHEARWTRSDGEWTFEIRGNGFLQYMVRTIVGTLLEVGQGRILPEQLPPIFEARNRRTAGPTAPPRGLHLMRVEY